MQLVQIQCVNAFVSTDQNVLIYNMETQTDHNWLIHEWSILNHKLFHLSSHILAFNTQVFLLHNNILTWHSQLSV